MHEDGFAGVENSVEFMTTPGDNVANYTKGKKFQPSFTICTVRLVALIEGVVYCVNVICVKLCNLKLGRKSKLK